MDYPTYRPQGLPITSAPIESTVKQINRRVKGAEKFRHRYHANQTGSNPYHHATKQPQSAQCTPA